MAPGREEAFLEECELLRSDMLQNDLEVLGEFVTEKTLREKWEWSETLGSTVDRRSMTALTNNACASFLSAASKDFPEGSDRGCEERLPENPKTLMRLAV